MLSVPSTDRLTATTVAGRYRPLGVISRGGMADVYEVLDLQSGDRVALKLVRSPDPELVRRLTREATVLEKIDHPNLVRLLDSGTSDGQAYLVMELVEGETLSEALARGRWSPDATAGLGADLAAALAYVHGLGIVHRDVKPSNILISAEGRPRLADFGISRLVDISTLTREGTTLGTVAYMAPEQIDSHAVGPPADVWALGIVLLECLTGRRVFTGSPGEVLAQRTAGLPPLGHIRSAPWRLVLSGMLENRPERRLSSDEVAALLATSSFTGEWEDPDPVAPTQAMNRPTAVGYVPRRSARVSGRRWRKVLLAVALVVVVAGGTALLGAPGGKPRPATSSGRRHQPSAASATTAPPYGVPLTALAGDVSSAEASGLEPAVGQQIEGDARQAVTDEASGASGPAAQALEQAAAVVDQSIQIDTVNVSEGARLESDLSQLAGALGVSLAVAAPPPGTRAPPPAPSAGGDKGHHGGDQG